MSSTPNNNTSDEEKIQNLKNDFADIRREIEQLLKEVQNRKANNTNTTVEEGTTLQSNANDYMYFGTEDEERNNLSMNFPFNNKSYSHDNTVVPNLPIVPNLNIFDPEEPYDDKKIQEYHDVASNLTGSQSMSIKNKYDIIKNAEKRREYLINIKKDTTSDEFQKLNEMYNKCETDEYCQGIINKWNNIESRRHSPQGTPRNGNISLPLNSSRQNTPRKNLNQKSLQAWKGGIKTRKTSHRKTKRRRTNKKSHSHKKRH